jgi:hypothetical protein
MWAMKMTKVYVVILHNLGAECIEGIFSNRKLAENAIKLYSRESAMPMHWYRIIERELDRVFQ